MFVARGLWEETISISFWEASLSGSQLFKLVAKELFSRKDCKDKVYSDSS